MAMEVVAEGALMAFELPFFQKPVGHGIMMDRQEEISSESIGRRLTRSSDEEHAAPEPVGTELLLDALGKIQIENKLRDAARAYRARRLRRMPDIDYYAKCRAPARIGEPGFGICRMRSGTRKRSRNEQPQDAQRPQHDRESPIVPWPVTLTICPFDGRSSWALFLLLTQNVR